MSFRRSLLQNGFALLAGACLAPPLSGCRGSSHSSNPYTGASSGRSVLDAKEQYRRIAQFSPQPTAKQSVLTLTRDGSLFVSRVVGNVDAPTPQIETLRYAAPWVRVMPTVVNFAPAIIDVDATTGNSFVNNGGVVTCYDSAGRSLFNIPGADSSTILSGLGAGLTSSEIWFAYIPVLNPVDSSMVHIVVDRYSINNGAFLSTSHLTSPYSTNSRSVRVAVKNNEIYIALGMPPSGQAGTSDDPVFAKIVVFDIGGAYKRVVALQPPASGVSPTDTTGKIVPNGVGAIRGFDVDTGGNCYLTGYDNSDEGTGESSIMKFSPSGTLLTTIFGYGIQVVAVSETEFHVVTDTGVYTYQRIS